MISQPFAILKPYAKRIKIAFLDKQDDVLEDKAAAKSIGMSKYCGLHQVHGGRAIIVREPRHSVDEADGMVTDQRNVALCIRSADCQTFVIYAPEHDVVGVLHAGWKGLLADMIPSFYRTLMDEWEILPSETLVGAAPSLCQTCADFTDPKKELPGIDKKFFDGKQVNLQGIADAQFLSLGVKKEYMERMPGCTRCSPETYWSYRGGGKEEVQAGHRNTFVVGLVG